MTNIQTANTIKLICKQKSISMTQMLKDCEITKSFIYDLEKRNTSPSCDKLSKIADYLDVSVDYLLGRTDKPNGYNNNSINISGHKQLDEMSEELLKRFNELPFDEKLDVFTYIKNKT